MTTFTCAGCQLKVGTTSKSPGIPIWVNSKPYCITCGDKAKKEVHSKVYTRIELNGDRTALFAAGWYATVDKNFGLSIWHPRDTPAEEGCRAIDYTWQPNFTRCITYLIEQGWLRSDIKPVITEWEAKIKRIMLRLPPWKCMEACNPGLTTTKFEWLPDGTFTAECNKCGAKMLCTAPQDVLASVPGEINDRPK